MEDVDVEGLEVQEVDAQEPDFKTKYAHLDLIHDVREELGDALNQADHFRGRKRFWGFMEIPTGGATSAGLALLHTQDPHYSVIGLLLAAGGAAASAFAAERFIRARGNESNAEFNVSKKRYELEKLKKEHGIK